jgi:hypothetical protein
MAKRLSIFSNVILVLQVFLVLLCFADLNSLPSPVLLAGRLHPLILHLPITLILLLLPLSFYAANRKEKKNIAAFFQLMLHCVALISTLTAITGFLLAAGGAYEADSLVIHKWLGVSIAILSHALIYLYNTLHTKPMAWNTFLVLTILVTIAGGHFGGTLTHGESFFSFSYNKKAVLANTSETEKIYPFAAASSSSIEKLNNPFRRVL